MQERAENLNIPPRYILEQAIRAFIIPSGLTKSGRNLLEALSDDPHPRAAIVYLFDREPDQSRKVIEVIGFILPEELAGFVNPTHLPIVKSGTEFETLFENGGALSTMRGALLIPGNILEQQGLLKHLVAVAETKFGAWQHHVTPDALSLATRSRIKDRKRLYCDPLLNKPLDSEICERLREQLAEGQKLAAAADPAETQFEILTRALERAKETFEWIGMSTADQIVHVSTDLTTIKRLKEQEGFVPEKDLSRMFDRFSGAAARREKLLLLAEHEQHGEFLITNYAAMARELNHLEGRERDAIGWVLKSHSAAMAPG